MGTVSFRKGNSMVKVPCLPGRSQCSVEVKWGLIKRGSNRRGVGIRRAVGELEKCVESSGIFEFGVAV